MADDDLIGQVIDGRYRIDEQIGAGAMGVVYRGRHVRLDKDVAIKVLRRDPGKSDALVRRLLKEARLASSLEHPNVVDLSDCGELASGGAYYVMELLSGETLAQTLERRRHVPPGEAFAIVEQIVAGLVAAHTREIVHRDLKPENVFLCRTSTGTPEVKLLDFGIAHAKGSTDTLPGAVLGTPEYMAPEQALGDTIDPRADLYALGVMLFELLTGRVPLFAKDMGELLRLKLQGEPPLLTQTAPGLLRMKQTEALIFRLLERDPDHRVQTIGEVKTLLSQAKAADLEPVEPAAPSVPAPAPSSGRRRTRGIGSGEIDEPSGADTDFSHAVGAEWRRPKTDPAPGTVPMGGAPPKGRTVPATDDRRVVVPGEMLEHDPMASRRVDRTAASPSVGPGVDTGSGAVVPVAAPAVAPPPRGTSKTPVLLGVAALVGVGVAAAVVLVGMPRLGHDPYADASHEAAKDPSHSEVVDPVPTSEPTPAEPTPAEPLAGAAAEAMAKSVAQSAVEVPVPPAIDPPLLPSGDPPDEVEAQTEAAVDARKAQPGGDPGATARQPSDAKPSRRDRSPAEPKPRDSDPRPAAEPTKSKAQRPAPADDDPVEDRSAASAESAESAEPAESAGDDPLDLVSPW